jgi:hypothetical protein
MANVIGIMCEIKTEEVEKARTDGNVYLGLGGREFGLDSEEDDFEWADSPTFVLGKDFDPSAINKRQVIQPTWNDPSDGYPLDMGRLDDFPVYVRFEPDDSDDEWCLSMVHVNVRDVDGDTVSYGTPEGFHHLWLSDDSGKILYLVKPRR